MALDKSIGQIQSNAASANGIPNSTYLIARVTHLVQGPYYMGTNVPDPYYKSPVDLGKITFQFLASPQDRTLQSAGNVPAQPFYSTLKQYPVEGEFVYILPGPSTLMNEARNQTTYYYLSSYNIWGSSHHNAFPDMGDYSAYLADVLDRSYADSAATNQSNNVSATGSLVMPLGPNFTELPNIKALRQFTGDTTIEGRWGNSIRFGSTNGGPEKYQNYWSNTGSLGNPITIIRNGQGTAQDSNLAWFPTVENINTDPSSIYLTNGQKIVIDDIDNSFSLASLGVTINSTLTVAIEVQQQLTSFHSTSPNEQDNRIKDLNS